MYMWARVFPFLLLQRIIPHSRWNLGSILFFRAAICLPHLSPFLLPLSSFPSPSLSSPPLIPSILSPFLRSHVLSCAWKTIMQGGIHLYRHCQYCPRFDPINIWLMRTFMVWPRIQTHHHIQCIGRYHHRFALECILCHIWTNNIHTYSLPLSLLLFLFLPSAGLFVRPVSPAGVYTMCVGVW